MLGDNNEPFRVTLSACGGSYRYSLSGGPALLKEIAGFLDDAPKSLTPINPELVSLRLLVQ